MIKHGIILVTLVAFTNLLLGGCTKIVNRQFHEVSDNPSANVSAVVTKQGEEVKFDRSGGTIDTEKQVVTGLSDTGQPLTIALEDMDYLKVKKVAVAKTVLLTTLTILLPLVLLTLHDLEDGWGN